MPFVLGSDPEQMWYNLKAITDLHIESDVLLSLCSDRSGHASSRLHGLLTPHDSTQQTWWKTRDRKLIVQMGLIQSKAAYVVSQQSDTDEITNIRRCSWTRGHLGWWEQLSNLVCLNPLTRLSSIKLNLIKHHLSNNPQNALLSSKCVFFFFIPTRFLNLHISCFLSSSFGLYDTQKSAYY